MYRSVIINLAAACIVGVGVAVGAMSCQAALTISATVGGGPIEGSYVSFDTLPLGSVGGNVDSVSVTFTGDAQAVRGSISGQYAEPYLSNANGTYFGNLNDGLDTTTYLSSGIGAVTLALPSPQKDIGLLWGSVDAYNTLNLYNGTTLVGSVTGADVIPTASGDQGINGTLYVNIHSTLAFDTVLALSSQYAFELDNFAFDAPAPVPEPPSAVLLGIGVIGLIRVRHNPRGSRTPSCRNRSAFQPP